MVEINCRPIGGPVPCLFDLIILIDCNMGSHNQLQSMESIRLVYKGTTKIRLAFLRLVIGHKVLHHNPRNPMTTWEIIDCKFSELIIQKDKALYVSLWMPKWRPELLRPTTAKKTCSTACS
ncbi:hypothetical protein VP01_507g6 [Puccinia sorghi]|uniref:Uncharacterized protein n=1 Tax=Puccinia sorghi TaxID=27349 RepID=A0A0L6UNF9_9BASI|nr:hypothetical protein VP01_507g6 [Puccinia sorghi]